MQVALVCYRYPGTITNKCQACRPLRRYSGCRLPRYVIDDDDNKPTSSGTFRSAPRPSRHAICGLLQRAPHHVRIFSVGIYRSSAKHPEYGQSTTKEG